MFDLWEFSSSDLALSIYVLFLIASIIILVVVVIYSDHKRFELARKQRTKKIIADFTEGVGEGCEGYNLFTNFAAIEKEKKAEKAVLSLKDRFGKNCIIRAVDLEEGATAMQRNNKKYSLN